MRSSRMRKEQFFSILLYFEPYWGPSLSAAGFVLEIIRGGLMITSIPLAWYSWRGASYNICIFLKFASLTKRLKCSLHSTLVIYYVCALFCTKGSLTWVHTRKHYSTILVLRSHFMNHKTSHKRSWLPVLVTHRDHHPWI